MVCEKCTSKLSKLATIHKASATTATTHSAATKSGRITNENKLLTHKKRFKPDKEEQYKKCRICLKLCHHVHAHYCQDCAYTKGICPMCGRKVIETSGYKQSLT